MKETAKAKRKTEMIRLSIDKLKIEARLQSSLDHAPSRQVAVWMLIRAALELAIEDSDVAMFMTATEEFRDKIISGSIMNDIYVRVVSED